MIKPMLAGKAPDFDKIQYPVLATPKIDGIRCLIVNGKAMSRSLKPIPNHYVRETIEASMSDAVESNLDGELVLDKQQPFNEVSSAIMSRDGRPNFVYKVFDVRIVGDYAKRMSILSDLNLPLFCDKVIPRFIVDAKQLEVYEETQLALGFEGVMIRSPYGPYKYGRSTTKEGYLLKIKRFVDSEAEVIGWEEMMHNSNPAFEGELGQTKRSSAQFGLVPTGLLGALIVRDLETKIVHNLGSGFTMDERAKLFKMAKEGEFNRPGWLASYKYQLHGTVDKPRTPIYKGLRHILDIS